MGTNFYRMPTSKKVLERYQKFHMKVEDMDFFNTQILFNQFRTIETPEGTVNPWEEFMDDMIVHLGKRSSGWKFCWNFHRGKYYSNKETLLKYIRSGRVIDEYGKLQDTEEFIEMALKWDGMIVDEKYLSEQGLNFGADKEVDGLRVSPHDDFC